MQNLHAPGINLNNFKAISELYYGHLHANIFYSHLKILSNF